MPPQPVVKRSILLTKSNENKQPIIADQKTKYPPEQNVNDSLKSKLVTKCLWSLFCLTGLMYQSILVTISYTEYPVTSQVTIEIEKEFDPVAMSFCLEFVSVRIPEKFPPKSACRRHVNFLVNPTEHNMCGEELAYDYDVKSLMENYTVDLIKTIREVLIFSSDEMIPKRVPFNQSVDHVEYYSFLKGYFKCLRVQHKLDQPMRLDLVSQLSVERNMLVVGGSIKSIKYDAPYMIIYAHDYSTFPYGMENKNFPESIARGLEEKQLSFQKTSSHYLPPPFFTKCTDGYSRGGIQSKAHCIESCMKDKLHHDFSHSYFGMTFINKTREKFGKFTGEKYKRLMEISSECQEKCSQACHVNNYLPVLASSYGGVPRSYRIHISFDYPTIRVEFSPKLSLLEYLIYIASCSGLWFGFCLYSSFKSMFGTVYVKINHYREKKVSQQIIQQNNSSLPPPVEN